MTETNFTIITGIPPVKVPEPSLTQKEEENLRVFANYLIDRFLEMKAKGLLKFQFKEDTLEIGERIYKLKPVVPLNLKIKCLWK